MAKKFQLKGLRQEKDKKVVLGEAQNIQIGEPKSQPLLGWRLVLLT